MIVIPDYNGPSDLHTFVRITLKASGICLRPDGNLSIA
jgi:hypothetical protein